MYRIKICGITNVADALAAVDAGADAIGLNFYRDSKRCIDAETAQSIVDAVRLRASVVGVFVNESADNIRAICGAVGLHLIQLHGDEPPEFLQLLNSDHDIVRAYRLGERGLAAIDDDLQACSDVSGFCPDAILIDAAVPGEFGGTGHTVEWRRLANHRNELLGDIPLILAGGLVPENVAEAVNAVHPHGVDVASGVESSPGKKDIAKVRDFVAAARAAFAEC